MTKHRTMSAPRRSQGGYVFLVSILIALVLMTTLFKTWAMFEERRSQNTFVEVEGNALAQLAVGLRGYVAEVQASSGGSLPANPFVVNGVAFLRPPTCGGLATNPPQGFVPCNYTGGTLGGNYQTTIRHDPVTNGIESRTEVMVPALNGDPGSRMVVADGVVQAALQQQALPSNGMFYTGFANVPSNFAPQAPPLPPVPLALSTNPNIADRGRVLLIVDNAPSNDIWLRTDGTNQMNANANMGGFSIRNATDGQFAGNVAVEQRIRAGEGIIVQSGLTELRGGLLIGRDAYMEDLGQFLSEGVYDAEVYVGNSNYVVPKITCPSTLRPAIYTSLQGTGTPNFAGSYNGDAIYESRVDVVDNGGSWTMTPVLQTLRLDLDADGFDVVLNRSLREVNPRDMRIAVFQRCAGA